MALKESCSRDVTLHLQAQSTVVSALTWHSRRQCAVLWVLLRKLLRSAVISALFA